MTGPRIDMLVFKVLLGSLSIILVVQMYLKIKGGLLWAASDSPKQQRIDFKFIRILLEDLVMLSLH